MRRLIIGIAAAAIATSAAAITPGNWETTSRLDDIVLPAGMPAGAEDMMRQMLGSEGITAQSCITQDQIDNAPQQLFDQTDGDCEYTDFAMAGGELHAVAQCRTDEGAMNMVMDGTYTDTTYAIAMRMQGDMGMGEMTMHFDVTGQRIGDCG